MTCDMTRRAHRIFRWEGHNLGVGPPGRWALKVHPLKNQKLIGFGPLFLGWAHLFKFFVLNFILPPFNLVWGHGRVVRHLSAFLPDVQAPNPLKAPSRLRSGLRGHTPSISGLCGTFQTLPEGPHSLMRVLSQIRPERAHPSILGLSWALPV